MQGLETALAAAQDDTEAATKSAVALTRELKKTRASAVTGQLRDLAKTLAQAEQLAAELAEQISRARAAYDVDESDLLASGAYTKELLAAAAEAGLSMFEEDGRLLCYPSLIRILPGEASIEIDRRKERWIRPSVVVERLASAQQAGPRFKAEPFLACLAAAYDLVVAKQGKDGGGSSSSKTSTGSSPCYLGKQEFARDLYLLDLSGFTDHIGRTMRWAASTGTRQAGVLTTVARSGQQQRYWGIAFQ